MGIFPTHSISPALFDDREILDDNARRASPCATALCLHAASFVHALLSLARTIARTMASAIARLAVSPRVNHRPHAVSRRASSRSRRAV